ncbi:hypothetical protein D3C81_1940620 [compost metagenome]
MGQPGRSRHVARYLADGVDRLDYRAVQPDFRHAVGLAGDAFYLSGASTVTDADRHPVRRFAGGSGADLPVVLRQQWPAGRLAGCA